MSETAQCPVCTAPQVDGIACHACVTKVEQHLHAVAALVDDLADAISKQARIGAGAGKSGPAHLRTPVNFGASDKARDLRGVLNAWAFEVWSDTPFPNGIPAPLSSPSAARVMLAHVTEIRRHPKVTQLIDEVTDAVTQARRSIDRPVERQYLGKCMVEQQNEHDQWVTCLAEVWAKPAAEETVCRTCGITHDVRERRAWLMLQAGDMLVTAKEASRYIGEVGHIQVTEASIRGLIHRPTNPLAYRPGTKTFRLGDLLDLITEMRVGNAA